MIEQLLATNCPKCQSTGRYWHQAGIFLVTKAQEENTSGGFAQAGAVVCPDCGLIEFYGAGARLLEQLPEAHVPTERPEHKQGSE